MNQLNANGQKHGPWEQYYENGQLHFRGFYMNGIFHNFFECYTQDGNLHLKGNLIKKISNGKAILKTVFTMAYLKYFMITDKYSLKVNTLMVVNVVYGNTIMKMV